MGVRRLTGMNSEAISVATQSVRAKTEPQEAFSGLRFAVVSPCFVTGPCSYLNSTPGRPAGCRTCYDGSVGVG